MSAEVLGERLKHISQMLAQDKLADEQIAQLLAATSEFVPGGVDDAYMLKCLFLGHYILENIKTI